MKFKRRALLVIGIVMLVLLAAGTALAWNDCPKGKINCTHPCRDYIDTNGNSICDRSESPSGDSTVPDSGPSEINIPENSEPSGGSGSLSGEPQLDGNDNSQDDIDVPAPEYDFNNENEEPLSNDIDVYNNSTSVAETSSSALMEPEFIVTLILLCGALLAVKRKWPLGARLLILGLGVLYLGLYIKGCMCPVGVLANIPVRLTEILNGQYTLWLGLFLLPILFVLLAGRIYCGGICPFGAIQEFTFRAGTKLGLNKGRPGLEKASWLKYLKYLILLAILLVTPLVGSAWWCKIDPFGYLFNFSGTNIALILLLVLLTTSLFISRPWCQIICPYGALLAIVSRDIGMLTGGKVGLLGPYIEKSGCKNCGRCETRCPVNAIQEGEIDTAECISCGECSKLCKVDAIQ